VPVRLFFFFLVRLFDPLEGLGWALGLEKCEGFYENICEGFFKNVLSRETRPLVWAAHGFGFWGFKEQWLVGHAPHVNLFANFYDTGMD